MPSSFMHKWPKTNRIAKSQICDDTFTFIVSYLDNHIHRDTPSCTQLGNKQRFANEASRPSRTSLSDNCYFRIIDMDDPNTFVTSKLRFG